MRGRIPQTFVDELLARTDIVDLIDEYVPLKRQGKDHAACCPFHDEKTASFTVSGEKQFYYCFGCQASGSALGFMMEYKALGFPEAVEELAERMGLEVPREGGTESGPRIDTGPLYGILEEANTYYRGQLRTHPDADRAVAYLKGRGLTGEVAGRFQLGFAPPGWDGLATALSSGEGRRAALVQAGLTAERGAGGHTSQYDRLRDRIVFPIRDSRGRVIGFGGRILEGDGPKYLNSPETPLFHKGRELYGLYQARQANPKPPRLLVVEGYMDVVALTQFGINYAVATLGTAVTRDHLEQLFKVSRDVVFSFDGDAAGRRAAWRAVETSLPFMREGRSAFFLFMPEGMDPDDYVRERGAESLTAAIEGATPLSEYLFQHAAQDVDLRTLEGRSRLVEQCRPFIERVPNGPFQALLGDRLAELSQMPPEKLTRLLGQQAPDNRTAAAPRTAGAESDGAGGPSLVRRALHLLVHDPSLVAKVGGGTERTTRFAALNLRGISLLVSVLDFLEERPDFTTGALLEQFREDDLGRHLARLAALPAPVLEAASESGTPGLEAEFRGILRRLDAAVSEQRYDALAYKGAPLTDAEKAEFRLLLEERKDSARR